MLKMSQTLCNLPSEEMAFLSKTKTCFTIYLKDTLNTLSVTNPLALSGWLALPFLLMLTVHSDISKTIFNHGLTNSSEKRWKGWGSCYSFSSNIFSTSVPAAFQSGMATPCGVYIYAHAQEVPNCTPTKK